MLGSGHDSYRASRRPQPPALKPPPLASKSERDARPSLSPFPFHFPSYPELFVLRSHAASVLVDPWLDSRAVCSVATHVLVMRERAIARGRLRFTNVLRYADMTNTTPRIRAKNSYMPCKVAQIAFGPPLSTCALHGAGVRDFVPDMTPPRRPGATPGLLQVSCW